MIIEALTAFVWLKDIDPIHLYGSSHHIYHLSLSNDNWLLKSSTTFSVCILILIICLLSSIIINVSQLYAVISDEWTQTKKLTDALEISETELNVIVYLCNTYLFI